MSNMFAETGFAWFLVNAGDFIETPVFVQEAECFDYEDVCPVDGPGKYKTYSAYHWYAGNSDRIEDTEIRTPEEAIRKIFPDARDIIPAPKKGEMCRFCQRVVDGPCVTHEGMNNCER